ncbi:MAG: head GIN domain-containing protein [Bacteroidota bacterium]
MKILNNAFILLATSFVLTSCFIDVERGSGNRSTEVREIEGFEEIEFSGSYSVYLEEGETEKVTITADDNLHQYITTENRGGKLAIDSEKNLSSRKGIEVYVTYKKLTGIYMSGASSVQNEGTLTGDQLRLSLSGAGSVDLKLELESLDLSISGAGSARLSGSCDKQNVSMSGAGGLKSYDLVSNTCYIGISGVGGAEITVLEKLSASVSGVGGIDYKGDPEILQKDVSGIGSIERSGDPNI